MGIHLLLHVLLLSDIVLLPLGLSQLQNLLQSFALGVCAKLAAATMAVEYCAHKGQGSAKKLPCCIAGHSSQGINDDNRLVKFGPSKPLSQEHVLCLCTAQLFHQAVQKLGVTVTAAAGRCRSWCGIRARQAEPRRYRSAVQKQRSQQYPYQARTVDTVHAVYLLLNQAALILTAEARRFGCVS